MKICKHYYIFVGIILSLNVSNASTNALWFIDIDDSVFEKKSDITADHVFALIEKEAKRLDAFGKGVNIINANAPFNNNKCKINYYKFQKIKLIELLNMTLESINMESIIIDDVAIIGRRNLRCVPLGIYGECHDATTGNPITDFKIESNPYPGKLNVLTNGSYICVLPCLISIIANDYAILATSEMFQEVKRFRVVAPGYREKCYSVNVFMPGKTAFQSVDISLEPVCAKGYTDPKDTVPLNAIKTIVEQRSDE